MLLGFLLELRLDFAERDWAVGCTLRLRAALVVGPASAPAEDEAGMLAPPVAPRSLVCGRQSNSKPTRSQKEAQSRIDYKNKI
jgi:hypothetical protein